MLHVTQNVDFSHYSLTYCCDNYDDFIAFIRLIRYGLYCGSVYHNVDCESSEKFQHLSHALDSYCST